MKKRGPLRALTRSRSSTRPDLAVSDHGAVIVRAARLFRTGATLQAYRRASGQRRGRSRQVVR